MAKPRIATTMRNRTPADTEPTIRARSVLHFHRHKWKQRVFLDTKIFDLLANPKQDLNVTCRGRCAWVISWKIYSNQILRSYLCNIMRYHITFSIIHLVPVMHGIFTGELILENTLELPKDTLYWHWYCPPCSLWVGTGNLALCWVREAWWVTSGDRLPTRYK